MHYSSTMKVSVPGKRHNKLQRTVDLPTGQQNQFSECWKKACVRRKITTCFCTYIYDLHENSETSEMITGTNHMRFLAFGISRVASIS